MLGGGHTQKAPTMETNLMYLSVSEDWSALGLKKTLFVIEVASAHFSLR